MDEPIKIGVSSTASVGDIERQNLEMNRSSEMSQAKKTMMVGALALVLGVFIERHRWLLWAIGGVTFYVGYQRYERADQTYSAGLVQNAARYG